MIELRNDVPCLYADFRSAGLEGHRHTRYFVDNHDEIEFFGISRDAAASWDGVTAPIRIFDPQDAPG